MRVEGLAPGGAGVGEQNVDVVCVLLDACEQRLNARDVGAVGGDGDGTGAGCEVGECVEGFGGCVAGGGFARGDEDFGAACFEEAVCNVSDASLPVREKDKRGLTLRRQSSPGHESRR